MAAFDPQAPVTGHPLAFMEEVDDLSAETGIERLFDQGVGHGIVVTADVHVVLNVDAHPFPLGIRIRQGGKRAQGGAIERVKRALPGAGQFLERTAVKFREDLPDGGIGLSQREEGVVAQPSQHPALDDLPPPFHFGLVAGPGRAGGHHGDPIRGGELHVRPVELGLIAVGMMHRRLQVVGDDDLRHATEGFKGADMGANPVGQALAPGGFDIGGVGGPEHRDEDLCLVYLAALAVHDGHRVPGRIDTELCAGPVPLAHDHIELARPGAIGLAKPAVLEALGHARLVCLPKPQQGDAFAFELLVHLSPVGRQRSDGALGGWGRKEKLFEGALIERVGQGPRQGGGLSPMDIVGDGGTA